MTATEKSITMPVGVVIRRTPGVTRWAKWAWKVVAVLPGAGPADWTELRRDGDSVEYHMGTLPMTLYRTDTEAYLEALNAPTPCVFVVLRQDDNTHPYNLHRVTTSAYEAQDYCDSGEEVVEPVPMPPGLAAWVQEFVDRHHTDVPFIKRQRDKRNVGDRQDGIGDARVRQPSDIYRSPTGKKDGGQR